jgi:hypothetical protein
LFCDLSAAEQYKSFLVQQFFKNAAEVEGEQPSSLPAGSETPLRHGLRRTVKRVRNHDSGFEGERTRPLSLVTTLNKLYLENVPVEHFQRVNTLKLISVVAD